MRHKHADLIHAWAEGAEIEIKLGAEWCNEEKPEWHTTFEYRIKPKEPEWWENIPEHGVLVEDIYTGITKLTATPAHPQEYRPLTNEEIEVFKR